MKPLKELEGDVLRNALLLGLVATLLNWICKNSQAVMDGLFPSLYFNAGAQ